MSKRDIFEESSKKLLQEIEDLRTLLLMTSARLEGKHDHADIKNMIREKLIEINKGRLKW